MKPFLNTTTVLTGALTAIAILGISAGLAIGHDDEYKDQKSAQAMSAKVTIEEAIQTAKTKFPGQVVEAELESEHGVLVYEVEIISASGKEHEIEIDALSGEILSSESEHEEDDHDPHETEKS